MSASNKGIWLVIIISAAAGIVAAIYVARLIGERSDRRVITSQVHEWAEPWVATRACLVGPEPAFESGGDSFLMYEAMHPDARGRLKDCEPLLRTLVRPGDVSTGDDTIEQSWADLRNATKKLVNAYALMLDPATLRAPGPRRARLASAIDGMDKAYAALRERSHMEPAPPPSGSGAPVELAAGTVVKAGDSPLLVHHVERAGQTLLIQGAVEDATTLAVVHGPESMQTVQLGDQAMRAADDTSWGTWVTRSGSKIELCAGALGPDGAPEDSGVVVANAAASRADIRPLFALGSDRMRTVIYEPVVFDDDDGATSQGVHLVRSTDGGATFGKPVMLASAPLLFSADDFARRRYDLVWLDSAGNAARWLSVRAAQLDALPPPRRLFDDASSMLDPCLADRAAWWLKWTLKYEPLTPGSTEDRLFPEDGAYSAEGAPTELAGAERIRYGDTLGVKVGELHYVAGDSTAARPVATLQSGQTLVACNEDRAAFGRIKDGSWSIRTCDPRSCQHAMEVPLNAFMPYAINLSASHGLIVATQASPLIVVWRPDAEPVAFVTKDDDVLHSVVEWQGALYFVMLHDGAVRLVPANLPAQ